VREHSDTPQPEHMQAQWQIDGDWSKDHDALIWGQTVVQWHGAKDT
jgi:hypothetical protein